MGVNKVDLKTGETIIDISKDTVTPGVLKQGFTAHDAKGEPIVGTMIPEGGSSSDSGIIDVTELPTENIDENAIYRLTSRLQTEKTEIYFVDGGGRYVLTINEYFANLGVPTIPNVYEVDDLSNMLDTDVQTFSAVYLYILRSNGIVYANVPAYGGIITCGLFGWNDLNYDKGITKNVYAETEDGVYTTLESYKDDVKYFIRKNGEWEPITATVYTETPHGFTDIEDNLAGIYTVGDSIEITENVESINILDMVVENRNIPSSISVNTPMYMMSDIISGNIYEEIPESFFIGKNGVISMIKAYAFYDCHNLRLTSLPYGISTIRMYAFYGCQRISLTSLPDSINIIESNAFYNCYDLALTSLPENLTRIGGYAFYNCNKLALTSLPENLTRIESSTFYGCYDLALTSLPENLTIIESYAFYGCNKLALTSLPESVNLIGSHAFYGCSNLALTSLPESLTNISLDAFKGCTNLALTSLPDSVTSIGLNAFDGCTSLTSITLPKSLTTIDFYAFKDCLGLTSVTFKTKPTSMGSFYVFEGCTNLKTINVPWSMGEVSYAPWGATNATINYNYTGE